MQHLEVSGAVRPIYGSLGIKPLNSLPRSINNLNDNPKQFKSALNTYLCAQSFYSVEEYFGVNKER